MTKSFLVVRLGSLGDLIHTLPAVAALRRAHPDARIDWLVEAPHRAILDLVPAIDDVIVMADRSVIAWRDARRVLIERGYDAALDFQGLIKSAALARLSGAREILGFDRDALREPMAHWFYSTAVPVGEGRHVIRKNLALVRHLAGAEADGPLTFPLGPVDSPALAAIRAQGIGKFALVNPGAAWPNKRWPAAQFGEIARTLADAHSLVPVVLWGPGEEELARAVVIASGERGVVAPQTELPDLVALSREASLIISGDTGPLHIACASGTPAVALFGPTDASRNGPWDPNDIVLTRYRKCPCHYKRACLQPAEWCLAEISVAEVTEAVAQRLAGLAT